MTPRFRTIRTTPDLDNGEREFLEASLTEIPEEVDSRSMWRVSSDGFASVIKGWWEDSPRSGHRPQTSLSPIWLSKDVAGCVLFARAFVNSLEAATAVTFRCEWTGLKDRRPSHPETRWLFSGCPSQDERRVSRQTISLAELNSGWETPAAALIGPVARAVGLGDSLTVKWLTWQAINWARQPQP